MMSQIRPTILAFVVGVLALGGASAQAVSYSDGPFTVDFTGSNGVLWDINSGVTFSSSSLTVDPVGYDAFASGGAPAIVDESLVMTFSTSSPLASYSSFTWSEEFEYEILNNGFVSLSATAVFNSIEVGGQPVPGTGPLFGGTLFQFEAFSGAGTESRSFTIDFADLGYENVTGFGLTLNNTLIAASQQGEAFIGKNSGGAEIDSEVIPEPTTAVMGMLVLSAVSASVLRRRRA